MKVIVYTTDDAEAPSGAHALARILDPFYAPATAPGRDGFAPIVFPAATVEAARAKAADHIAVLNARAAAKSNRKAPIRKKPSPDEAETLYEEEAI